MRRLDRYIFREILTPSLIALAALTFVVFSRQVGLLLDAIVRHSATAADIWAYSSAILPTVMTVTLPMAVLVGILTGFGRMSSDSEIIALRASGISMLRILRPVFLFACTASAVTLALSVWIAPQTFARLKSLQQELALKYVSLELKPRVFNERLSGFVLYYHDSSTEDGLEWRGIMLADVRNPDDPQVTFAESGRLVPDYLHRRAQLTLSNGRKNAVSPTSPAIDDSSKLDETNLVLPLPDVVAAPKETVKEIPTWELWQHVQGGIAGREEQTEFHQRFALPFACLAFALVGLPLGISTTRGGRSMGLVLSLILMFAYYLALIGGTRVSGQSSLSPLVGTWLPNVGFAVLGLILLARSDREYQNRGLMMIAAAAQWLSSRLAALKPRKLNLSGWAYTFTHHSKFFRILDVYVLRGFWFFFTIVLSVFVSLFIIVTLFELLEDIVKNNVATRVVVTYFFFLLPQILYYMVPLAVLLAILINLGTLTKRNEVLAVKAGAVSLYRLSLPLILMGALLSGAIYVMQDFLLPRSNKLQDEYHDIIKGKAPQTHSDPQRKWMKGSDDRIYYYNYFDADANVFGNISIWKVDSKTFAPREWTFAKRGAWMDGAWTFEDGWTREISDESTRYTPFERLNLVGMDSPDYFKREVRETDQMSYVELTRYVEKTRQSGFDVTGLTLDLYRKFSFPLVSLIMAIIGVPFSFKTGRKGAFYGIGFCLAVGIIYWSTFELFDKLGDINRLSPWIAAWFPNLIFGTGGIWMMLRVKT